MVIGLPELFQVNSAALSKVRVINKLYCQLCFLLNCCRYYKVNEVQKFTYSRRKDTNTSDVTVVKFICRILHVL